MARKSKTSKNSEENKESEAVEVAEDAASAAEANDESNPTENASDETDTDADAADPKDGEEVTAEGTDAESPVVASDEDANLALEDDPADQASNDTEEPVETSVAGVVPAQAEEPASPTPPPAAPAAPAPSAFPLVFGGLAAGAIGFLVATFAVPEGWPNPTSEAPALDLEVTARLDALTERLDNLPEAPSDATAGETVDLSPLLERLDAVEGQSAGIAETVAALEASSAALSARIDEIANRPNVVAPDGSAAMEAQLETFRRDLDAVTAAARAEIEEAQARSSQIEAEAAAAAEAAARNAALAELRASLEDGSPFVEPLATLGDVPVALSGVAADGVMPLSDLQDQFPDAARATLQETHAVPTDASATERFASFVRRHTNARSLAPREGDDVDAILSRAEAALMAGDLDAALAELAALPEGESGEAMQAWIGNAQTRADAVSAMNDLN